jgi:hypothetical protein
MKDEQDGKPFVMQWSKGLMIFRQYGGSARCEHSTIMKRFSSLEQWLSVCEQCDATIIGKSFRR